MYTRRVAQLRSQQVLLDSVPSFSGFPCGIWHARHKTTLKIGQLNPLSLSVYIYIYVGV